MKIRTAILAICALTYALGQAVDWPSDRGDPQRSGFQSHEHILSPDSAGSMKLLWKRKLDSDPQGLTSLTTPTILGRIITHHGFQELIFIASHSEKVFAIDADLNRILWMRSLGTPTAMRRTTPNSCNEGLTATPVFPPTPGGRPDNDEDNPFPIRPLYVLASGGKLLTLHPMTGKDMFGSMRFLGPNAVSSDLNLAGSLVYATTSMQCGEVPDGVWAVNRNHPEAKISFFPTGATKAESAGVAIGYNGTVYAATGHGESGEIQDSIVALTRGDLKLKSSYALQKREIPNRGGSDPASVSPVVFRCQGRELIASADGSRVVILDANNLGGATHHEGLVVSAEVGGAVISSLATWQDPEGGRWIYLASRAASDHLAAVKPFEGIVAFKLQEKNNRLALSQVWKSPAMISPASPVVANGVVYCLSTGEFAGQANRVEERVSRSTHAVLYALDARSGKQLYSSENAITSFVHSSGIAVANGHVCFGTWDSTLYCFGLPIDI
jgi:outer membrane protein assembly factor BamB